MITHFHLKVPTPWTLAEGKIDTTLAERTWFS